MVVEWWQWCILDAAFGVACAHIGPILGGAYYFQTPRRLKLAADRLRRWSYISRLDDAADDRPT